MANFPQQNRTYESPLGQPEALWWFFQDHDGKEQGPMPFRELRECALKKSLLDNMLVWREGEKARYPSQKIIGLLPHSQPDPDEETGPVSSIDNDNPYATPNTERPIAEGPPGGLYLPHLRETHFLALFGFSTTAIGLIYLGTTLSDPPTRSIVFAFSIIALLGWLSFTLIYLKRAWDMMNMLGAPMTGVKAVAVFLIPFLNAIWPFIAIYGWSKLWNFNATRHPGLSDAHSVWRLMFLLFCVAFMMSQVIILMLWMSKEIPNNLDNSRHQFALGTFAATFILSLGTWYQLCRSVNFLARKKS